MQCHGKRCKEDERQASICSVGVKIKKIEFENVEFKGDGYVCVNLYQRFQELALMCDRMFSEESDKVEKYVGGLPDMIHGSVMATKPKTMQDAIEFATELMDKKISTLAERQAENKRKLDNNNQTQQQLPKRGRMWLKLTPLGLVKGRKTVGVLLLLTIREPSLAMNVESRALQGVGPELKNGNQLDVLKHVGKGACLSRR
ncbi:hypothetical protein Tco_0491136 [Tanacetum coccineum]